jgi:hypothetical protein
MARRNISLAIRVTIDEYLRIKKGAEKARMSVTGYVVGKCLMEEVTVGGKLFKFKD